MNWEYILTFLGSIGILELAKFIYNLFIRRKTDARLAVVEAKSSEFAQLQTTNEWLQQRLQSALERNEEITQLSRNKNDEILRLTRELAQKDVDMAREKANYDVLIARVRCDELECPFREPPTAYTQPVSGITKEQYHKQKREKRKVEM